MSFSVAKRVTLHDAHTKKLDFPHGYCTSFTSPHQYSTGFGSGSLMSTSSHSNPGKFGSGKDWVSHSGLDLD